MDRGRYGSASAALSAFLNDRQQNRLLTLKFPHGDGPSGSLMLANKLTAREHMSRDFEFKVEVISDDALLPLKERIAQC